MIQNKCQQKAFLPQIYKQSCMAAGVIRDTATAGTSVSSLEGSEEEIFCQLSFCLRNSWGSEQQIEGLKMDLGEHTETS